MDDCSLVRWRLMAQRLLRALVDLVGVAGSPVLLSRWCIGGPSGPSGGQLGTRG